MKRPSRQPYGSRLATGFPYFSEEAEAETFDVDAFLAEIKEEPGVSVNATAVEAPLAYFARAQEAGLLAGLVIQEDDGGRPFLLALVPTGAGGEVVLASRSPAEVEPDDDEES